MAEQEQSWAYWLYLLVFVVSFGILATRAIGLMVIRGSYYQGLAWDNRVVEKRIPAARGGIVDRKGRTIAESYYQYFKTENGEKIFLGKGG